MLRERLIEQLKATLHKTLQERLKLSTLEVVGETMFAGI
jgi:hypothetical protein